MIHEKNAIQQYINEHKNEMIELWRTFVNMKSRAREREEAYDFCIFLKSVLEEIGFKCTVCSVGNTNAPILVADYGEVENKSAIIFSGHYDTVSLPGEHPFKIYGGSCAAGLACLDMKGGIVIAIFVFKALKHLGWKTHPIRFIFVGDEEKGHQNANTPELIMALAKGSLCAFNMETSPINNAVCISRKGGGLAKFDVFGISAHAGNDFSKGRNAIAEAVVKMGAIQSLTDIIKGTTVSVTVANGGSVPNSIPPSCHFEVDVRYTQHSEKDRLLEAFEAIKNHVHIEGCHTEFEYNEYMAPFEETDEGIRLATFIASISDALELTKMGQVRLGGGSDAAYLSLAGVPTVCSLGVRGEFNHTNREYAVIDSLYERVLLLTEVVLHIDTFLKG